MYQNVGHYVSGVSCNLYVRQSDVWERPSEKVNQRWCVVCLHCAVTQHFKWHQCETLIRSYGRKLRYIKYYGAYVQDDTVVMRALEVSSCCVHTYILLCHGEDVGAFQNLDLLTLRICRHRRGGVHRRVPGSARHPPDAFRPKHPPQGAS